MAVFLGCVAFDPPLADPRFFEKMREKSLKMPSFWPKSPQNRNYRQPMAIDKKLVIDASSFERWNLKSY
jgi:hypothetical protein